MANPTRATGAWLLAAAAVIAGQAPAAAQQAARRWTYDDPGLVVPKTVSIGNDGTQVFTASEGSFSGSSRLLSSHDHDPASPVWQHTTYGEVRNARVDSSDSGDVHATLQMEPVGGTQYRAVVKGATSADSHGSSWQWAFPSTFFLHQDASVFVADDGRRVVASLYQQGQGSVHVVAFDPLSGAKTRDFVVPVFNGYHYSELSSDGSTLYLANTLKSYVVDVDGGGLLDDVSTYLGVLDGHVVSRDGSKFFVGAYNLVRAYQKGPGGDYSQSQSFTLDGAQGFCNRLALSRDGRKLVAAFLINANVRDMRVVVWDVASGAKLSDDYLAGGGGFSNQITGLDVSADGSVYAVGCWGDEAGLIPELLLYETGDPAPYATFHLAGSVTDLDLSENGDYVAIARKSIHANLSGSGGSVELFQTRARDIQIEGIPRLDAPPVQLRVRPKSGPSVFVLSNTSPASPPLTFDAGTLHIERIGMKITALAPLGGGQYGTSWAFRSSDGLQTGDTVYFQAFSSYPRLLGDDWLGATILP